ncbi:hypothetical protein KL86DES1_21148 [uncultured Desulfovibrio sp.]|uniref:Uncharacterized protein n=1 Tax=uncultured Desulfovibrio sp. TaxID=167968 RepID=A0A212L6L6_9BACT|nr:hypothetical protein KL86DES1_21148 [uncultured Desulfovibrio sp.]VZH34045.1 conserved protein of unknown function [Desulfovibrio sp. 86]
MDSEGILNACTTNVRITRASSKATKRASPYSRHRGFLGGADLKSVVIGCCSLFFLALGPNYMQAAKYALMRAQRQGGVKLNLLWNIYSLRPPAQKTRPRSIRGLEHMRWTLRKHRLEHFNFEKV